MKQRASRVTGRRSRAKHMVVAGAGRLLSGLGGALVAVGGSAPSGRRRGLATVLTDLAWEVAAFIVVTYALQVLPQPLHAAVSRRVWPLGLCVWLFAGAVLVPPLRRRRPRRASR